MLLSLQLKEFEAFTKIFIVQIDFATYLDIDAHIIRNQIKIYTVNEWHYFNQIKRNLQMQQIYFESSQC